MAVADVTRLTADHPVSVTAKSALTDLDTTLLASTVYAFHYVLYCTANVATVGVQFALRFSGTVTRLDAFKEYWAAATTKDAMSIIGAVSSPQNFNSLTSKGNVVQPILIDGILEVGASGGTFGLDHGSETASLTTVLRGSYGIVSPV